MYIHFYEMIYMYRSVSEFIGIILERYSNEKTSFYPIFIDDNSSIDIKPDNNINETINILGSFVGESVPVIDNKNVLIGIISENDVLQIYKNITNEIRSIEKNGNY